MIPILVAVAVVAVVAVTFVITAAMCGHQNESLPWKRREPRSRS